MRLVIRHETSLFTFQLRLTWLALPVSPFVVVNMSAPPVTLQRGATALPHTALCLRHARIFTLATARFPDFYSGHTPSLVRLKYLADVAKRRRTNGGGIRPSYISRNEMKF